MDSEDIRDCKGAATKHLGVEVVSPKIVVLFLYFSINKIKCCVCLGGFNLEMIICFLVFQCDDYFLLYCTK